MEQITNDYEAFLAIKTHLLQQNEQAKDDADDCRYRGYKGETLSINRDLAEEYCLQKDFYTDRDVQEIFEANLAKIGPDAMCAVGCLISDEFYHQNMEGTTIDGNNDIADALMKSHPLWNMDANSFTMLKRMQELHDFTHVDNWNSKLSEFDSDLNFNKNNRYIVNEEDEDE